MLPVLYSFLYSVCCCIFYKVLINLLHSLKVSIISHNGVQRFLGRIGMCSTPHPTYTTHPWKPGRQRKCSNTLESTWGSEPSPHHHTQPSSLVFHPPAQLLTVTIGVSTFPALSKPPFPPTPLLVPLLCSEPRAAPKITTVRHGQARELLCLCLCLYKTKASPRNSKAEPRRGQRR